MRKNNNNDGIMADSINMRPRTRIYSLHKKIEERRDSPVVSSSWLRESKGVTAGPPPPCSRLQRALPKKPSSDINIPDMRDATRLLYWSSRRLFPFRGSRSRHANALSSLSRALPLIILSWCPFESLHFSCLEFPKVLLRDVHATAQVAHLVHLEILALLA